MDGFVRLFAGFALFSLILSCFPFATSQTVPDPDHMIVARTRLPLRIDPARVQWNEEFELALNVYEPLIFFDKEKINDFAPRIAASWNISPDGLNYTFTLRSGVSFHNGEALTSEDVEYSVERVLVNDVGWAAWTFYDSLFGLPGSRDKDGNIAITASQIDNAITRNETAVTFHLTRPYPPFMQILASVGLIVSKDWCVTLGEWPQTWNNWTEYNQQPSLIDQQDTEPPGPHTNAMCGTGPFMLDYYQHGVNISLVKFDDYWGGWPAPGAKSSLQRVTAMKIDDWATRRDLFLAGQVDSIYPYDVAYAQEVIGQPGISSIYPLPLLTCNAMFFVFNISTSSPFLGVPGGLQPGTFDESGIPPDFFNDINVRKGFAYSFNYTQYIEEGLLGDAFQPATPIIPGLPFHNPAQEKYCLNLTRAQEHFEKVWDGQLWANGFNLTIGYNAGNLRLKVCEILKFNIESINPRFHINIEDVGPHYSEYRDAKELPILVHGWIADFADPHDFALGFMKSNYRTFPDMQNYVNATIDTLVDAGIAVSDPAERQETYYELQRLYWEDCPAVVLHQPRVRMFMRDWVQGWYYNVLLWTLNYFYSQWKEYIPPHPLSAGENVVDAVDPSGTIVSINTTSEGNLTITSHSINLEGVTVEGTLVHYVKCVTVDTTIPPENIIFPIEVRIYYTDQEVISTYVDQSTLRMYYWNETKWILEEDTGAVAPSDIPGYAGYVWAKIYHLSLFSVWGQPLLHDVAVTSLTTSKTVVGRGYLTLIDATLENHGGYDETVSVTFYTNTTAIGSIPNIVLTSGNSRNVAFPWNTTTFAKGNYTISAYAQPVSGETDTADNDFADGTVYVGIPGDTNGDGFVELMDFYYASLAFGSEPGDHNWNPNTDVNDDSIVEMMDFFIISQHFGQHYP